MQAQLKRHYCNIKLATAKNSKQLKAFVQE